MHAARSVEQKDLSLKDFFTGKEKEAVLEITGLASKYVPKYHNENNPGYHTMIYLKDGRKTGAFSNALFEFAKFFYELAGLDVDSTFNKLEFPNGVLKVKVIKVDLDKGKTTYNFEIIEEGSELNGVARMGKIEGIKPMLLESGTMDA